MKLSKPVRMVATDHAGFQLSGWKSEILRQRRVLHLNRPLGVIIKMLGGLNGNSAGNISFP